MFKKILLPIDLTETEQPIDIATALAGAFDSELQLVNLQSLVPVAFCGSLGKSQYRGSTSARRDCSQRQ